MKEIKDMNVNELMGASICLGKTVICLKEELKKVKVYSVKNFVDVIGNLSDYLESLSNEIEIRREELCKLHTQEN